MAKMIKWNNFLNNALERDGPRLSTRKQQSQMNKSSTGAISFYSTSFFFSSNKRKVEMRQFSWESVLQIHRFFYIDLLCVKGRYHFCFFSIYPWRVVERMLLFDFRHSRHFPQHENCPKISLTLSISNWTIGSCQEHSLECSCIFSPPYWKN